MFSKQFLEDPDKIQHVVIQQRYKEVQTHVRKRKEFSFPLYSKLVCILLGEVYQQ